MGVLRAEVSSPETPATRAASESGTEYAAVGAVAFEPSLTNDPRLVSSAFSVVAAVAVTST